VERGSAYVLAGEARSRWQHSIPAMKAERWSITFRTLKAAPAERGGGARRALRAPSGGEG
jgi:hypothetical protein